MLLSRMDEALKYIREQKEYTDTRVKSGIEMYRKGEGTLRLLSKEPLPDDVVVEIEQTDHEFRFGANIFMLDEFETEEKNKQFRNNFPELFNLATLPFYWKDMEPEKGKIRWSKDAPKRYRRPPIDLCLEYCEKNGIEPKAHCLNYDYFTPAWLYGATIDEQKKALEQRFRVLAEKYAYRIPSWEVTNETFNIEFVREFLNDNHYSKFYREKDFNKWSFLTADKYFPNNHLIINDHLDFGCMRSLHGEFFGQRSPYYMQIDQMMKDGVNHLDSIGFQFHCFFSPEKEKDLAISRYNPQHIFDVLDTYEALGKKLQITEMTISAFGDDEENEEVQSELIKNLYSIFFSHPSMEAIIYWNMYDGYASGMIGDMKSGENKYYGGLCSFDMREKPAYKVLKELITKQWHTSIKMTPKNGKINFRGFYGDYIVKIHLADKVITTQYRLSSSANNIKDIRI